MRLTADKVRLNGVVVRLNADVVRLNADVGRLIYNGSKYLRLSPKEEEILFANWVATLDDNGEYIIYTSPLDVLGGNRPLAMSAFVLRKIVLLKYEKGRLSADTIHKSSIRDMALAIRYMRGRNMFKLPNYFLHLLFKAMFQVTVEECIQSREVGFEVKFNTPIMWRPPKQD